VGIDPNSCIFPIAFGVVEVGCTSAWEWFLTTLKDDLNITNTSPWTIMIDRCNIPGCEARNRENTEVCIAFMHKKSWKFLRF
jgi:hypothetical protein